MELQTFAAVDVARVDGHVIRVVVPSTMQGVLVGDIHKKVCGELDLKNSSSQFFPLFLGRKKQIKKLKDTDYIQAPCADLCIRKWCFNKSTEKEMIEGDKQACHLVYLEAEKSVCSGFLKPSKSQTEKFEEYSDPEFKLEQKYIQVCHDIPEYFSVHIKECQASQSFGGPVNPAFSGEVDENFSNIFAQDVHNSEHEFTVAVTISDTGITLHKDQVAKVLPWCCIIRWSIKSSEQQISYVFLDSQSHEQNVQLESPQVEFILTATCELVKEKQRQDPSLPPFLASMISSQPDGTVCWENALLDQIKAKKYNIGAVL